MQFYSPNSQKLFDDIIFLPQEGAVAGPTGRPPNSYAILFDDHSILFDAAILVEYERHSRTCRSG